MYAGVKLKEIYSVDGIFLTGFDTGRGSIRLVEVFDPSVLNGPSYRSIVSFRRLIHRGRDSIEFFGSMTSLLINLQNVIIFFSLDLRPMKKEGRKYMRPIKNSFPF